MYSLATKCTTKNEVRNAISVYVYCYTCAWESKSHGSFCQQLFMTRCRELDCSLCGLRIADADPQ